MPPIVLCYHKVGPQREEGRRLNVDPRRLHSHAAYFKRKGYRFVRAGELASPWADRAVCLSFDDAYWSTLEWGLPVLDRLGVAATIYAVAGLVGTCSTWDSASPRPLAGWDGLREAQSRGHEIGNHTLTHARLAGLSLEEQIQEIRACHEALVSQGLNPQSFCYPYGRFDDASLSAVETVGYKVGLALGKRLPTESDNRLAIPRIVVAFSDSLPALFYKIFMRGSGRRSVVGGR